MQNEIVRAEHLCVRYGTVEAVHNASFSIEEGEVLAIIGPNGSGKTSTADCVAGLRRPSSGTIAVFGLDPWKNRKEVYRRMGVQLQAPDYAKHIRVGEVCELYSCLGTEHANWLPLVDALGLRRCLQAPAAVLSGGERQKLSIVLALMNRPKFLILDEMTTGLDPEARHDLLGHLRDLKRNSISMLLISHNLDEVEALCDRILFLNAGVQHFLGTLAQFREYAADADAASASSRSLEDLYLNLITRGQHRSREATR